MDHIQTPTRTGQARKGAECSKSRNPRGDSMSYQERKLGTQNTRESNVDNAEYMERTLPAGKLEQCPPIVDQQHYITQVSSINEAIATTAIQPPTFADEMLDTLKRHSVMTEEEQIAIVLWIIASYQINAFRIFPKLSLISPEKRCGKTTTMEVINALANNPLLVSNVSPAVLYRVTAKSQPTLLIDEVDMLIQQGETAIIGLINSSHNQSAATVLRCVGDTHETKPFSTWIPIVLASIGALPHTIMDRSVVINLRRKAAHEAVQSPSVRIVDDCETIRDSCRQWSLATSAQLERHVVEPPYIGNDRAQDNWTPLFTVAAALGGTWPNRCEKAYDSLTSASEPELPTQLLEAIRALFAEANTDQLSSTEIVSMLLQDADGPWNAMPTGGSLTPIKMAALLKPYGISPQCRRMGSKTIRGYKLAQFTDAFERYLPPPPR